MVEIAKTPAANPRAQSPRIPASLTTRVLTILVIAVPFAGVVIALFSLWGWGFHWTDFGLMLGMYVLTVLGITVGFHRLFVHRSFETFLWLKIIWAILGSMAVQGPLLKWVGMHRWHHQHSDTPEDLHSPHHCGSGTIGLLRGFWHAQIGWLFDPEPAGLDRYTVDLMAVTPLRWINALFPLWVMLGLLIPAILGGLLTQSWIGMWTGFFWGGLVRIFLVHHVTWSVNSACHLWGRQPFKSDDESRNNFFFGVLALGEGWHNTHHAFPTSARHGLRWWEIDLSYWVIHTMSLCGLAWNVKVPTAKSIVRERRTN